jgi:vacuolar-type H+-ATPase subunit E/Vma4
MSLESLVAAIREEGRAQAAAIERAAEEEAAHIAAEAAREAERVRVEAQQEALQPLAVRRGPRILQAQLDAANVREAERALLVETALAAATKELKEIRAGSTYEALLARLLAEALAALDAPGAVLIEVDPRDEALLRALLTANGLTDDRPVTIRPSLHTGGGVCVATADGRLRVDNTVETRLARALPALRSDLARFFQAAEA